MSTTEKKPPKKESVDWAAGVLDMSRCTVHALIKTGKLRCHRMGVTGRLVRITEDHIQEYRRLTETKLAGEKPTVSLAPVQARRSHRPGEILAGRVASRRGWGVSEQEKWSYLTPSGVAVEAFDSWEEAVFEATQDDETDDRFIELGVERPPIAAEGYVHADYILDHIAGQEEYECDWAEPGWPNCTEEQQGELTAKLQEVVGEWLDRNELRPTWVMVDVVDRKTKVDAIASVEARKATK